MSDNYVDYTIFLGSKQQVEDLQKANGRATNPRNTVGSVLFSSPLLGKGKLYAGPERAALEFPGCVVVNTSQPIPSNPPYITSPSILGVGTPDRFPTDVDSFKKGWAGWLGLGALFGIKKTWTWLGRYEYKPPKEAQTDDFPEPTPEAISQRRWIDGFELPKAGEGAGGGESAMAFYCSRNASRHGDGYGLQLVDPGLFIRNHATDENRTGLLPTGSWERIYLELVSVPTAPFEFMYLHHSAGASYGIVLSILPSGQIAVNDVNAGGTRTQMGTTSALVLSTGATRKWYRLDILAKTGAAVGGASCQLYLNGAQVLNITGFGTGGWGSTLNGGVHSNTQVGNVASATTPICMHLDDWVNADYPVLAANSKGLDWLNGSKIVRLDATGYGTGHDVAAWPQPYQSLWANPTDDADSSQDKITGSALGPKLCITTDVVYKTQQDPRAIKAGLVAMVGGFSGAAVAGFTPGTLDYSIDGGAFVTTPELNQATLNWSNLSYLPAGLIEPIVMNSLELRYSPGLSAHNRTVRSFGAVAEILGCFGAEDLAPETSVDNPDPPARINGDHNAPWPRSVWATSKSAPISPVIITAGTYVGNGTVTQLKFKSPVSWMVIRRVSAATAHGLSWWSSMAFANEGGVLRSAPESLSRTSWLMTNPAPGPGEDVQESECILNIVGAEAKSNAAGATYQYVAFQDPGMRFCLNGALDHFAGATDRTTLLWKPAFTPMAAFFHKSQITGGTNSGHFYKGPGHATQSVSKLDAAETASAVAFGAGSILSRSAFVPATGAGNVHDFAFSAWRNNDGSGDPGITKVVQIGSYVGNGGAGQVINLAPSGVRPMWVLVVPHNGAAIYRDPSHTGTTSSVWGSGFSDASNASTGIVGGAVDSFQVGSALNTNGVTYDYFVIMGCVGAGNNGWGANCESVPVEPAPPVDWPTNDPPDHDPEDPNFPTDPDDPNNPSNPLPTPNDPSAPEFGSQCVAASTKVCNQALVKCGSTQLIGDIVTESTPEANNCRLFYDDVVLAVLREFPWAFATKYATLGVVTGFLSAPNDDWDWAYRKPTDCVFPRRIVKQDGTQREFDPDPIPFREGVDTTGGLIYTNEPNAKLEYTFRPQCAASAGDALFREALMWKLVQHLAPSIAKDKKLVPQAIAAYERALNVAAARNLRGEQKPEIDGDPDWLRGR